MNDINSQSMLRIGTILRGIYKIESYLSSGGFGNTYIAKNIEFDEQYAIKEFFWKGVAERDKNQTTVSISNSENVDNFNTQREKFKKEARRLRQLNNTHIVKVYDLFEENGTAYYVMDYVDGENLSTRLKRTNEPLTETEVRNILPQVLDALKAVHAAGIWHLDLKPANIMVDKSGNVKLIDFGASKQLNAQKGGATTSTAISYTNGYAPREQMEQNYDKFGPWTDIYALGATLYALLTNKRPPLPTDIDDDISEDKHVALPFPSTVSEEMKSLVLKMMKTNRMQRPQSVEDIRIEEAKTPEPVETHEPAETSEADNTQEETQILNKETKTEKKNEETIIAEVPKNGWGRETGKDYTTGLELDWVYEGEFKNGKRNGKGTMTWSNGEKHEGGFQDGYFHGAGVHTYSNGEIVRGVWEYGGLKEKTSTTKEEKKGRNWGCVIFFILMLIFSLVLISIAFFGSRKAENPDSILPDSVMLSDSVMQYSTAIGKCLYSGEVNADNIPHGYGGAYFDDGRYYRGHFENGVLDGDNAHFEYPNGDVFEGTFKNNSFYQGTYTIAEDGSYFTGSYKNGEPKSGTWYNKKGEIINHINN